MGRFIVLFSFLLFAVDIQAKELIIVSDLDETLKMANVENKIRAAGKILKGVRPYTAMHLILNDLQAQNPTAKFYYVSNSFWFTYNGRKWINRHGFPQGKIIQRHKGESVSTFKAIQLQKINDMHPEAKYILFGDNIDRDVTFYRDFLEQYKIDGHALIRDARLEFPENLESLTYFQHEAQLNLVSWLELSSQVSAEIAMMPLWKMIPMYLKNNLWKRLLKTCYIIPRQEDTCFNTAASEYERRMNLIGSF